MRKVLVYCLLASPLFAADLKSLRVGPAAGTRFALEVEKTGLLSGKKHLFLFERYSGILQLDPAAPEKSRRLNEALREASAVASEQKNPQPLLAKYGTEAKMRKTN